MRGNAEIWSARMHGSSFEKQNLQIRLIELPSSSMFILSDDWEFSSWIFFLREVVKSLIQIYRV